MTKPPQSLRQLPKGYWGLWLVGLLLSVGALFAFIWGCLHPEHSLTRWVTTFVPLMIGLTINLVISLRRNDWKLSASHHDPN
jgi:hypothetical protein